MTAAHLRRRTAVVGFATVAFVLLSLFVAAGAFAALDRSVAGAVARLWVPALEPLFRGIAMLGGIEATSLVAAGLFIYLWRTGRRAAAPAVGVLFASVAIEIAFKKFLLHPGLPHDMSHLDGPSLSDLVESVARFKSSFPSGHMMRTVIVYGLVTFVVQRLAPSDLARRLAILATAALILLMAFDRLYLEVHWESDVLGGLLLGGVALGAGITWLELHGGAAE